MRKWRRTPHASAGQVVAKQYRVPFSYLYLPDTPQKTKRLEKADYRTFDNLGPGEMSREFVF